MALLVQRVSGSYYGNYYMPCAAGVGYSYSPYRFLKSTDPAAGMLRLVMGLGTSAVDRTEGSYPRLVSLDVPERSVYTNEADRHRYSQRAVEVINMPDRKLEQIMLKTFEPQIPEYLGRILLEHDYDAEYRLRETGRRQNVRFISCKGLVENAQIMKLMQKTLLGIQKEYEYPVDIEFTVNISESGEFSINLLQCRPLQVLKDQKQVVIPENIQKENIFLESRGASMGRSRAVDVDVIMAVDPIAYYEMPYALKTSVARLIGKVNWYFRGKNKHMMLLVPGRIGTSSPELGVPTSFSDISEFEVVCEIEETKAGYNPELSYGSHIFQDLVEAEILYTAVFGNQKTIVFAPEKLSEYRNITEEFEGGTELKNIAAVYDLGESPFELYYDMQEDHLLVKA